VHRRALACLAALMVSAIAVLALPGPVGAGVVPGGSVHGIAQQPQEDPDGDPSTDDAPLPEQDIIPRPNSGRPPTDAGDRGGALQGLVFALIVIGVGGIAVLAVRESRRARARSATGSDAPAQVNSP
jgi:hypothetical protein